VPTRLSRSFQRLMHLVPAGAQLESMRDLVREDLVDDAKVMALVGNRHFSDDDPISRRANLPRVRPILVALAARAAGADSVDDETLYAAELLHLALGVHDFAFGRQGGRRRRVARRVVKRSVGWLSGNHLTLRALELTRHGSPGVMGELVDTLREFSDGQELSRALQQGAVPTREDWEEHADLLTGALFAFCCRSGGLVAGADPRILSALGRFGRHLGRLWHAAEDVSVIEHGDAGAHLWARALAGRPVLAVIESEEMDPGIGQAWAELVLSPQAEAADAIHQRILRAGGLPRTREIIVRESWSARRALRVLPESRYRTALDRFAMDLAKAGFRGPPST
jgi:octaprenyl-diphosphate synthase